MTRTSEMAGVVVVSGDTHLEDDTVVLEITDMRLWIVYAPDSDGEYDTFKSGVVLAETAHDAIKIVRATTTCLVVESDGDGIEDIAYPVVHDHSDVLVAVEVNAAYPRMIHSHMHYG